MVGAGYFGKIYMILGGIRSVFISEGSQNDEGGMRVFCRREGSAFQAVSKKKRGWPDSPVQVIFFQI